MRSSLSFLKVYAFYSAAHNYLIFEMILWFLLSNFVIYHSQVLFRGILSKQKTNQNIIKIIFFNYNIECIICAFCDINNITNVFAYCVLFDYINT